MIEREIILLLKKISKQLEDVIESQKDINGDILELKKEVACFQQVTLRDLENKLKMVVTESFH